MGSAVLALPKGVLGPAEVGSIGAFFDFDVAAPQQEEKLGSRETRLISNLISQLDIYLTKAISAGTPAAFDKQREKVWPKYVRSLRALQDTIANFLPESTLEQLRNEAVTALENDFRKSGMERFGPRLTEQAEFTLWTLGKIRTLGKQLFSLEVSDAKRKEDMRLCQQYHLDSLWSQFHMDCLVAAEKFDISVDENIRESVCEGLRAAVNAYATMRAALALRIPPIERPSVALPWDEEDERLLASSMRDVNADFSDD
jgi:hypothetical protein